MCVFSYTGCFERSHIGKSKDRILNQKIKEFLNKTIIKNVFLLKILHYITKNTKLFVYKINYIIFKY